MTRVGEIAPMDGGVWPGSPGRGFPTRVVHIEEIDALGYAYCVDNIGRRMAPINTRVRRAAILPQPGEDWIADQSLGFWSFAAAVNRVLPVVRGSTSNIPAVNSLLQALSQLGIINDQTYAVILTGASVSSGAVRFR